MKTYEEGETRNKDLNAGTNAERICVHLVTGPMTKWGIARATAAEDTREEKTTLTESIAETNATIV